MTTTLYQRSRAGTLPRTGRFHHDGTTTTKWERRPSSGTAYRFSPRVTNAGIDPIADRKVQEHLAYLRRLANQKIVSVELANKARAVWFSRCYRPKSICPCLSRLRQHCKVVRSNTTGPLGHTNYYWRFRPMAFAIGRTRTRPQANFEASKPPQMTNCQIDWNGSFLKLR